MAWWCLRSEEQLNLRFQGDFSPWLFLPIYYPKETFPGSVQKSGGSCTSTHCSMTSQRFRSSPLLPNGPPTNMKANLRKFLSWSKKLFESFFFCSTQKEPCVFWSRFRTVCPNVPTDQWVSVKILSILRFSHRKCSCFSLCLHTIPTPPRLLTFCSFDIQIDELLSSALSKNSWTLQFK